MGVVAAFLFVLVIILASIGGIFLLLSLVLGVILKKRTALFLLIPAVILTLPLIFGSLLSSGIKRNETIQHRQEIGPFLTAVDKGDRDLVREMLENGEDVNQVESSDHPVSALILAVSRKDMKMVQLLLESGADPNAYIEDSIPHYQQTPLFEAIASDQPEMVRFLVENGASVDSPGDPAGGISRMSAFHYTARYSMNSEIMEYMASRCKDINSRYDFNQTALHLALNPSESSSSNFPRRKARFNRVAFGKILLEHGADPNLVNDWGKTALHQVAYMDYLDLMELLLAAGADPDIKDEKGLSVRMMCKRSFPDGLELIKKYCPVENM